MRSNKREPAIMLWKANQGANKSDWEGTNQESGTTGSKGIGKGSGSNVAEAR